MAFDIQKLKLEVADAADNGFRVRIIQEGVVVIGDEVDRSAINANALAETVLHGLLTTWLKETPETISQVPACKELAEYLVDKGYAVKKGD